MTFNPSTTIYLCNVDFDNTYKNVRYFPDRAAQIQFFMSKVVERFDDYVTVRKVLPSGGTVSRVRVEAGIEQLRSYPCNYMVYQNKNHGNRYFYAFITEFVYINEGVTEIQFETDVFQTWFHDVQIMPSYVVREHGETDGIGDNITPEQFGADDFEYTDLKIENRCGDWGYLLGTSDTLDGTESKGRIMSGIYQGIYLYFYPESAVQELNNFLSTLESDGKDVVLFLMAVPEYNVSLNRVPPASGLLMQSFEPRNDLVDITISKAGNAFGNYTPKNNKLHTFPYEALVSSNHSGQEVEYRIEDFSNRDTIRFKIFADVCANPSMTMIPRYYQGITDNYDAGISISNFPQCAYNTDTFKLWLAKNQYGIATDNLMNVGKIVGGVASIAATALTAGVSAPVTVGGGVALIASGAAGIANTMNNVHTASKEPNRVSGMGAKNNLLTAIGFNRFDFYVRRIKEAHARTIDDYFTMFGYQTNRVKYPNLSSRPYFNYVQTIDVNITGGIPNDDMATLKNIFNRGVTLWKSGCDVGDYHVNNKP